MGSVKKAVLQQSALNLETRKLVRGLAADLVRVRFLMKQSGIVPAPSELLLTDLGRAVPGIVLNDLSSQYRQAKWIEPGHFELWLAPSLTRLAIR